MLCYYPAARPLRFGEMGGKGLRWIGGVCRWFPNLSGGGGKNCPIAIAPMQMIKTAPTFVAPQAMLQDWTLWSLFPRLFIWLNCHLQKVSVIAHWRQAIRRTTVARMCRRARWKNTRKPPMAPEVIWIGTKMFHGASVQDWPGVLIFVVPTRFNHCASYITC